MSYIQITTRCNMLCEHCCYSCTAEGKDMTRKTFRAAVAWARDYKGDETISLGGGEPTIHPRFWEFLGLALGNFDYVWMATNGKETETALNLARMARRGVIGCALSQDEYHGRIDPRVIGAFMDGRKPYPSQFERENHDFREIRDVTQKVVKSGRAEENENWEEEGCPCPDFLIDPAGNIHGCGCVDAPVFGNVVRPTGVKIPENWEYGTCWKEQETLQKVREA